MNRDDNLESLAEGHHIRFVRRDGWEFAQRRDINGIVGIVALTTDDKLILVEQYRPPLQTSAIELPAGLAGDDQDHRDESLESAARRELLEETGYLADEWSVLATGVTSPGITDECVTIFLATGLRRQDGNTADDTRRITVHEVPLAGLYERLADFTRQGKAVNFMVYTALVAHVN